MVYSQQTRGSGLSSGPPDGLKSVTKLHRPRAHTVIVIAIELRGIMEKYVAACHIRPDMSDNVFCSQECGEVTGAHCRPGTGYKVLR